MPYACRVHIQEGRELKGVDDGGMSDPFVLVTCCGQKQETTKFEKCSSAVFDKMMMFNLDTLSPKQFQTGVIKIEAFDYNAFSDDILIGAFEFGTGNVNMQPGHEYHNVWIGLINPVMGFDMQGYLKVSVSAIKDSQSHADHAADEEEEEESGDLASMVMMPPGVKMAPYRLSVFCYRAVDLPQLDTLGWCDGFVRVIYSGAEIASEVVPGRKDPEWKEELMLPVMTPTMADAIDISLFDDDFPSDDFVGSCPYSWKELMDKAIIGPHWAHLYGWPEDADEEITLELANAGVRPFDYKGRVLLAFEVEEDKNARIGKKNCPTVEEPENVEYEFRVDLFQVSELPESVEDSEIYIEFGQGSKLDETMWTRSETVELVGNSSDAWMQNRKKGQLKLRSLYWPAIKKSNCYHEKQVPDLFINVMYVPVIGDDKRIGYVRFEYDMKKSKELAKDEILWYSLRKDPFSGMVDKDGIPGFIQMRVQYGERKKLPRAGGWPATRKQDYLLRCHIFQGQGLPAADAEGTSDAFVIMRMAGKKGQTKTCYCTCFPRWYETVELEVSVPTNADLLPNVYFLLYDEDEWGPPDYLGRFAVPAGTIPQKYKPELGDEDWYPLGVSDDPNDTRGKVLATFQLMPVKDIPKMKAAGTFGPHPEHEEGMITIFPEHNPCIFECFLIGIRNLESYNLFECSDPWVEFDCGDRSPENVHRTAQGDSPNASFCELIQVNCQLPQKSIFAPYLNVKIYDERLLGPTQVGSSSIPVAPYTTWNDEEIEVALPEEAPEAEEVIEEEEIIIPQDYLPFEYEEMNETLHPEYKDWKFDTVMRGGQRGQRTIPPTEPVSMGGDDEEEEGAGKKKKHPVKDRPCYEKAWEFSPEGFNRENKPPMHVYDIMRGGGGMLSPEKCVGKLKMRCRAYIEGSQEHLDEPTVEDHWAEMRQDKKMVLRFYLIRGINLMAQDDDGFSDPFVNVKLTGHEPIMDKDRSLRNKTLCPNFYLYYEFKDVIMPGDHTLDIEVWDEDLIGDDNIGIASVDLEDRHYTKSWYERDIEAKKWQPKEWLPIISPSTPVPQGKLECWIDLLDDKEAGQVPIVSLEPPKGDPWELRVVVWRVDELNFRDSEEYNLFVSGNVEYKSVEDEKMKRQDRQDTDTQFFMKPEHYGSFHWRLVFPVQIPCGIPKLLIQSWDLALASPNDAICEANIQLGGFFKKAEKTGTRESADLDVNMTHPNYRGVQGKVQLSVEILPEKEALEDEVDTGREPELLDREGMYEWYRPPIPFPVFGIWMMIKAKLAPLKNYCIGCCFLLCLVACAMIYIQISDETLKTDIQTVSHSDYELIGVRGVTWTWNKKAEERFGVFGASSGVIAQEVEQVYPWAVLSFNGYKRVNYLWLNLLVVVAKAAALVL